MPTRFVPTDFDLSFHFDSHPVPRPLLSVFADTVCDSDWGVGLSTGLRGRMDHLDGKATQ